MYRAAKETVALAEERMTNPSEDDRPEFDSAWQEMMNHATMRVRNILYLGFSKEVYQ